MAEAAVVRKAQYFRVPKPGERRASAYKKVREDGVSESKYKSKISSELVDNLIEPAFADLEALDRILTEILNRHGIYGNARIAYRNYARELYAFGRRYGKVPPDYVAALRREKALKGATLLDVLREIDDAVALFLGIGQIVAPEEEQRRGARGRAGGGAGGGEEQISISP
jgi:hypothetical protein